MLADGAIHIAKTTAKYTLTVQAIFVRQTVVGVKTSAGGLRRS
jgi:hypothetical protein